MEEPKKKVEETLINGFSPVSSAPVFWKSRRRAEGNMMSMVELDQRCRLQMRIHAEQLLLPAASAKNLDKATENDTDNTPQTQEEPTTQAMQEESSTPVFLSEKRKALFEPLEPISNINGRRLSAEMLLPPPDFDAASYPKGWLIGKKRKLVNVDVVESMRRIAVQEMNRKDREIDGLNEQLEEDARCLEHLQLQLLEERSKRADAERQSAMLQNQITMLMDMLQENDNVDDDEGAGEP